MPTLEIEINIKRDGQPIATFPNVRRIVVNELQVQTLQQPTGASFVAVPGTPPSSGAVMNACVITADQAIAVHLNGQTAGDTGIVLNAGGLLLVIDGNMTSATWATVQNNSGATANVQAITAGT